MDRIQLKDNAILTIDLTSSKSSKVEITRSQRKNFVGGVGINTQILYESDAMYHDALSEKNVLIFGVGPAVGTGLLAGNRCTVTARSPITDMYGDSNVGGDLTVKMRSVGVDHLVFTGKAEKPVYVVINPEGEVSILDASDLWGMWTDRVTDLLMERHGKHAEVACIGPAGENLVRYASVVMSKCHVAGRTGMGCVMGSKNLKAVVIEGSRKWQPPMYDREEISRIRKLWLEQCRTSVVSKMGGIEGTLFLIETYDKDKHVPVRNSKTPHDEKMKNIYSNEFKYGYQTKRKACYACPVACTKEYEIKEGKYKGDKGDRIDYGTVTSLGPCLGIFDWGDIIHLKLLTDYLGMDTIEIAGAIALLMECTERGLTTGTPAEEFPIEFGDTEKVEELFYRIVNREGIGDLLAEGAYRAAEALKAQEYVFTINKSTTGLHSKDRLAWSMAYMTSTRGGDHLKAFVFSVLSKGYFASVVSKYIFKMDANKAIDQPERQGRIVAWHENYKSIIDALGICIFAIHGVPNKGHAFFHDFAQVMKGLYNLDCTDQDIYYAGERIYQLQNAFNIRCGLTLKNYQWPVRKQDTDIDPEYVLETTIKTRDEAGMLPEYFTFRGLNPEGKPTSARFQELGLDPRDREGGPSILVQDDHVTSIPELFQMVGLNANLSKIDRLKGEMISWLLCRLLEKRDKRDEKAYFKKKKAQALNIK
ncbi:aldehyde ferredoxin oxidoreductase family protein [Dehalobacterium formicoaceticum]|uniref:Aldehyde ferredoxin oxidoreductase family protein n=2 Tax=Dehalobacterium formicoaceticum TaxID=51515 RepID=A0ABT1XZW5_9FIRM|nr:aldehyde ferredoxin oxidoreductase family protein [Dehalobacterium formicoaceticum]MCR6544159.1 aldehyde ferredoxin oxidoreductase family protein [Dehalobacterium formicoaceticum]